MMNSAIEKSHQISPGSVVSWALYDLANTIFSTNIVSLYFPLWVVNVMGGRDFQFALADSISMLLLFMVAPVLGAVSDQVHKRMPFLITTSLLCIALTALLGQGGLLVSLAVFAAANFMYQSGLLFYNAMLLDVSTPANQGRIGGLGTGLGYVGALIGVGLGVWLLQGASSAEITPASAAEVSGRYTSVFQMSALLFLIFAVPCFLFVKERFREKSKLPAGLLGQAFSQLRYTLAHAKEYPGLLRFLLSRIFYIDAVNTVIVFLGIYTTKEIGFTEQDFQGIFIASILSAVIGSFGWGALVDRIGPKRTLNLVLVLWMLIFLGTALIGFFHLPKENFWPLAILAGISLGGTWSADRPFMLRLSPPKYVGEFFGLYTMAGRFAAVIGPLLWSLIADLLGLGRPAAVLSLLVMVLIGFIIVQRVDDQMRDWEQ